MSYMDQQDMLNIKEEEASQLENIPMGLHQNLGIKQTPVGVEEEVNVKAELDLYADHEIKEELVLGPVELQPPDSQARIALQSESVTPGPSTATQVMFDQATRGSVVEPEPRLWVPKQTQLKRSALTSFDNFQNPRDSVRRRITPKNALEQSIHVAPIERAAAMDLDEEEGEEYVDHVQKWLGGMETVESVDHAPYSCSTLVPLEAGQDAISGIISVQPEPRAVPSNGKEASMATSGDIDVRPPSQGMVHTSKRTARADNKGSDFDSEYDDEFDLEELVAFDSVCRDIPASGELTGPVRKIVDTVSGAMDEAANRLISASDFIWHDDFETFGAKPEVFSGPNPGPVKDYDTPYDAFTDIWSAGFMEHIVLETNRYAKQTINNLKAGGSLKVSSRLHSWTDTNVDEMYVFFALFIYMGIDIRTSQQEYWKTTGRLEMPMFRQLMSYNRFILLNKFLHFVDNSDESQDLPQAGGTELSAKVAKIAPILVHLNNKFESLYNLGTDIAIDDSLTLYKGSLSWIQVIRSKAARFGIKSCELCEPRTGYLFRFQVYTGKNFVRGGDIVAPSVDLAGKSTQVVLELLKGLENRGHLVTMDNFYNCPALARYLKSLGFDCLGSLRTNRKHVPVEIAKAPKNVGKGSIIARHCGDVSCVAWKDSKLVTMISTYHTDETYMGQTAGRSFVKPCVVRDYNNIMAGIDLKDQKLSMYLTERKRCVKWYMKIFKRLLNTSVLNSFVLLTESLRRRGMDVMSHRDFRELLANCLVDRHFKQDNSAAAYVALTRRLDRSIVHGPAVRQGNSRRECHICLRNDIKRRVSLKCTACDIFLCEGDCWAAWHTAQQLPGREVHLRRRQT